MNVKMEQMMNSDTNADATSVSPYNSNTHVICRAFRHGSLFSGIGGFDLAAEWMSWENVFQVEIDKYCQKVLAKNFPNTKRYSDIKEFDATEYKGTIDVISGGFPCQPFSVAGKQKGKEDTRFLWHEMLRVIREVEPKFVVGENVPGIRNMELHNILSDLEDEGYKTETYIIPACAVNAPHKRERVWIIAYANSIRCENEQKENGQLIHNREWNNTVSEQRWNEQQCRIGKSNTFFANANGEHGKEFKQRNKLGYERKEASFGRRVYEPDWQKEWTEVATELCRMDDGLPKELDAGKRITALGNSIVPQVAFEIFKVVGGVLRHGV